MHDMIDIWLYSWHNVHLTITLTDFITVHLYFACYFSLILVYIIITCIHVICTCTFPFILHTHWVAFWRPWICTSRCWMFYFIYQVFDETEHVARSLESSLFDFWYSTFLYSVDFLILDIWTNCLFHSFYSSVIMCGHSYVILQCYHVIIGII